MRFLRLVAVATLISCMAAGSAHGQTLLKRLESKIKDAAGALAAPDPATAPAPGYLGVRVDETPVPGQGVLVQGVTKGAPSELGGLREGDVITAIDDKPCLRLDDLDAVLGKGTVGTKIKFTVNRAGRSEALNVTLGRKPIVASGVAGNPGEPIAPAPTLNDPTLPPVATPPVFSPPAVAPPADPLLPPTRGPFDPPTPAPSLNPATPGTPSLELPAPPPADAPLPAPSPGPSAESPFSAPAPSAAGRPSLGISVLPLNEETRAQFGVRSTVRSGAVIQGVRPGGPADTAGLPLGGVIVQIDGIRVDTPDDLIGVISASRPGREIELSYYDGDRLFRKSLTIGASASIAATPSIPTDPPSERSILGTGDRPLLRRFENVVDSLTPEPRTPIGSTILDPSAIKTLFERVQFLEERVKLLEAKLSDTPPVTNPLTP